MTRDDLRALIWRAASKEGGVSIADVEKILKGADAYAAYIHAGVIAQRQATLRVRTVLNLPRTIHLQLAEADEPYSACGNSRCQLTESPAYVTCVKCKRTGAYRKAAAVCA